jgi:hypothetical protein
MSLDRDGAIVLHRVPGFASSPYKTADSSASRNSSPRGANVCRRLSPSQGDPATGLLSALAMVVVNDLRWVT